MSGERLECALAAVADDLIESAYKIRRENKYADHVTDEKKEANLQAMLDRAFRIRSGQEHMGLWLWQRVNMKLTGECVGFFGR